jgi:hypothetical protein
MRIRGAQEELESLSATGYSRADRGAAAQVVHANRLVTFADGVDMMEVFQINFFQPLITNELLSGRSTDLG